MASSFARSAGDFSDGCGGTPAAWPAPSTVGGGGPPALSRLLCLLVDWLAQAPALDGRGDPVTCPTSRSRLLPPAAGSSPLACLPFRLSHHVAPLVAHRRRRLSPVLALNPCRPGPRGLSQPLVPLLSAGPTRFIGPASSSVSHGESLAGLPVPGGSCLGLGGLVPSLVEFAMTTAALALAATALVEASPGGVPGDQAQALIRAAAVLVGRGSSQSCRGRPAVVSAHTASDESPAASWSSCCTAAAAGPNLAAASPAPSEPPGVVSSANTTVTAAAAGDGA
ncbi:unnamed protein product [Closterium sp. Naga37s-1]|nr:unnamed protein product [Closterium sp. Naga37s-1]